MKLPPLSAILLSMASLAPIIPAAIIAGPVFAQPEAPAAVQPVTQATEGAAELVNDPDLRADTLSQ